MHRRYGSLSTVQPASAQWPRQAEHGLSCFIPDLDMPAGTDMKSPSPAGSLSQAQLSDLGSQTLASVPPDSDAEQILSPLPVGSRQVVPDSSRHGSGTSTASGQAVGTQMALSGDGLSLRLEALRALSRLLAEDQSKQEVGIAASPWHVTCGQA